MVHPGNAGINTGQFFAAVSDNLKARMSDANTCLKALEPTSWPNDDSRLIYGEESIIKLTKRLKLKSRPTVEQFFKPCHV